MARNVVKRGSLFDFRVSVVRLCLLVQVGIHCRKIGETGWNESKFWGESRTEGKRWRKGKILSRLKECHSIMKPDMNKDGVCFAWESTSWQYSKTRPTKSKWIWKVVNIIRSSFARPLVPVISLVFMSHLFRKENNSGNCLCYCNFKYKKTKEYLNHCFKTKD